MDVLPVQEPISAGVILSYRCTCECRHCMYASSPRWESPWMSTSDLAVVLDHLSRSFSGKYPRGVRGVLGINYGLHFTGGEPFLNYQLLLRAVEMASERGIPSLFVETNCFWCVSDEVARERLARLRDAGLDGILVSANPFVVECVPFSRIERCYRASLEVFGPSNVMVYHPAFYEHLASMGLRGTIRFEDYLAELLGSGGPALSALTNPAIVLPMGRLVYELGHLYPRFPAKRFFGESCLSELTRPWHVHVDCYNNYVPGYCAGISLGDARRLPDIVSGVDLGDRPILRALATDIRELYELAVREYGYRERREGYVSKCHLCVDIRRHIALETNEFKELRPLEFYRHLTRASA